MRRGWLKGVMLAGTAAMLAGCVSTEDIYHAPPPPPQPDLAMQMPSPQQLPGPLQCVPYARDHSKVKIFGDAYTWWDKAAGKYTRGALPDVGSVMVLNNYAGPERGHLAVVRRVVGAREIRVDHANWLEDGSIYVNNPVEDVSRDNDWSVVRVFNLKTGGWGSRLYPVQGFIGSTPDSDHPGLTAKNGGSQMGATALAGEIN